MILLHESAWEIKSTPKKGKGIFARQDILPGTVIGDYIGRVIKTAEEDTSEKDGLYLLYYHDYASLYPEDLTKPGIHLINHSCTPTCWIKIYKGHTLFFTTRKVFAGEELTVSYQLSPDTYCNPCPHACHCGATSCTGTMHLSQAAFEQWNQFSEHEAKETKRASIRYGKILPRLKEYPLTIPDNPIYKLVGSIQHPPKRMDIRSLPDTEKVRALIRDSGQTLFFPLLKKTIMGVQNNQLILDI